MNLDWQTLAAAGIVIITLTIFLIRFTHPKRKPDCGKDCDCGK